MLYGEKLKFLREEMELNQTQAANIIEISNSRYNIYENETELIPINHLINLCKYFDVSLDYIFSFTNLRKYENSNDIDLNLIRKRLKEFRRENKLTQIELANILKVANGTIANYETCRYLIATPFLYTICKKYNISADYLLGKINNPKSF